MAKRMKNCTRITFGSLHFSIKILMNCHTLILKKGELAISQHMISLKKGKHKQFKRHTQTVWSYVEFNYIHNLFCHKTKSTKIFEFFQLNHYHSVVKVILWLLFKVTVIQWHFYEIEANNFTEYIPDSSSQKMCAFIFTVLFQCFNFHDKYRRCENWISFGSKYFWM